MSSESANKRQRRSPCDAPDRSIADVEAMLDKRLLQMGQQMQSKIDALEGRCKDLEDTCESLRRSLEALAGRWEYSAPDVPVSHWLELGHTEGYADAATDFVRRMKSRASQLVDGNLTDGLSLSMSFDDDHDIDFTNALRTGENELLLIHDDVLLPHWKNLAEAINLYRGDAGVFLLEGVELPPKVLQILTPSLKALRGITEIKLVGNDFTDSREGATLATDLVRNSPSLDTFMWVNTRIDRLTDVRCLGEALSSHPSVRRVRIENCCDQISSMGYELLTFLVSGTSSFEILDIDANYIRTFGRNDLSGYLAANPPLKTLHLSDNNLNDNDAMMIAEALKQNANLRDLWWVKMRSQRSDKVRCEMLSLIRRA